MKSSVTNQPGPPIRRVRTPWLALIPVLAILCLAASPPSTSGPRRADCEASGLVGAWNVDLTVNSVPGTFPKLITFTSDGIVLGDEIAFPPGETTAHGNWIATGPRKAAYTFHAFVGDNDGNLAMKLKVVGELQYKAQGDTWSGPLKVQLLDPDGNEVFADRGAFTAKRIAVERLD